MKKHPLELVARALEKEARLPKNKEYRRVLLQMAGHTRSAGNVAAFDEHQKILAKLERA